MAIETSTTESYEIPEPTLTPQQQEAIKNFDTGWLNNPTNKLNDSQVEVLFTHYLDETNYKQEKEALDSLLNNGIDEARHKLLIQTTRDTYLDKFYKNILGPTTTITPGSTPPKITVDKLGTSERTILVADMKQKFLDENAKKQREKTEKKAMKDSSVSDYSKVAILQDQIEARKAGKTTLKGTDKTYVTKKEKNIELLEKQIADSNKKEQEAREKTGKIVKIVAIAAGAGIAFATPTISIGAAIAVALGGQGIGKYIESKSAKFRQEAIAKRYYNPVGMSAEQRAEIEQSIKKSERWANILYYLAQVVKGGTIGYGAGSIIKNLLGMYNTPTSTSNLPSAEQSIKPSSTTVTEQSVTSNISKQSVNQFANVSADTTTSAAKHIASTAENIATTNNASDLFNGPFFDLDKLGWDPGTAQKWGLKGSRILLEGSEPANRQAIYFRKLGELLTPEQIKLNQNTIIPIWRDVDAHRAQPIQAAIQVAKQITTAV